MRVKSNQEHQYSFDELGAITIPANSFTDLLVATKAFPEIQDAFGKHYNKFATGDYENIAVSVSGGADSDRLIDFIERVGYPQDTVHYIFFDTGMEFQATKEHLLDLEVKYEISIDRIHARTPVALACRKYGVPFLSKQVSDYICRLQSHGFKWEDRPFEELYAEYPKCKAALRWCVTSGEKTADSIFATGNG